jgi:hypothetical protein
MAHEHFNGSQEVSEQNGIHQLLVHADDFNLLDNIINTRNHNMRISLKGRKIVKVWCIQN